MNSEPHFSYSINDLGELGTPSQRFVVPHRCTDLLPPQISVYRALLLRGLQEFFLEVDGC